MAVRNAAAHVRAAVASILEQEGVALELIVVENGSSDDTPRILGELAKADPRIRILRTEPSGLTAALIEGCAAARADVIARQDAGDVSLPRRLRTQLDLLLRDPQCVLVSCGVRYTGPEGEELYTATESDGEAVRRSLLHDDAAHVRGLNHHGTAMFRRKAYEEAGGYRAQFWFAQDLDLWMRLAARGTIAFAPDVLYVASITPEAISSLHRREQEELTRLAVSLRETRDERETRNLLSEAVRVRPESSRPSARAAAGGYYFIGRCLQKRGDARARRYLAGCVRRDPLHVRGWAALAGSLFLRRRA